MSYLRTLCALTLGAALAACAGEAVAPSAGPLRLSSGVQVIYDNGRALGHCFWQVGINAPKVQPVAGGTTITAPGGQVVTRVSIKTGNMCLFTPDSTLGTFTFDDGKAPCYVIDGLGTATATVRRVGSGRNCKEIAQLQFVSAAPPPPPVDGGGSGGGSGGGTGGGGVVDTIPPGAITVCEAATNPIATPFAVTIGNETGGLAQLAVSVGQCSAPTSLGVGTYSVSQALPVGIVMLEIFIEPEGQIISADPFLGTATVTVASGATTTVTFLNDTPVLSQ